VSFVPASGTDRNAIRPAHRDDRVNTDLFIAVVLDGLLKCFRLFHAKNFSKSSVVSQGIYCRNMQVYPMKGYGAVEIGVHRFYHPKSSTPSGEARFVHLWQYKDGAWRITRVISFDRYAAK